MIEVRNIPGRYLPKCLLEKMRFQGADILRAESVTASYLMRNLGLIDTGRSRKTPKLDQEISLRQRDDRHYRKYQSKNTGDLSLFEGMNETLYVHLFV
jgi:hypothetical protein